VDHKEIWFESVDWFHLVHDKVKWLTLVNTVINLRVPPIHTHTHTETTMKY